MSLTIKNLPILGGGSGIPLEAFGCTKCTVDEFTFASSATGADITCSMDEMPKYAWFVREDFNEGELTGEQLIFNGGKTTLSLATYYTYPQNGLGYGSNVYRQLTNSYLSFGVSYTGEVRVVGGGRYGTLLAGVKYRLIAIA